MSDGLTGIATQVADALYVASWGVIIGIGQSLMAREKDLGIIIGRAICVGGLSMSAFSALVLAPGLSINAVAGIAAALATVGAGVLEKIIYAAIDKVLDARQAAREQGHE